MSTLKIEGLAGVLEELSLSNTPPTLAALDTLNNPLDVLRTVLADVLVSLIQCDAANAYKALQWPNDIYNGDLSVTLPRLQPGCKPKELSSELVDIV